jgi:transposase
MRRTHLRGHGNILKRLLVHAAACNLGLWMRMNVLTFNLTDMVESSLS